MKKMIGNTDFINLPLFIKGKVRDVYDLDKELLIVVTDRISAFDVVFPNLIPNKGVVLNSITEFWFNFTSDIIGNHMVTTDVSKYTMGLDKFGDELKGRSMLVKKVEMLSVECVVRGYLEGSALKEYTKTGHVSGIKLPSGLKQADKLPEPMFTPSTKAKDGHDENITFGELKNIIGDEMADSLQNISLKLYEKASGYTENRGLILADTKFEFGLLNGQLVVADEIFTPDSSRFWDMDEYEAGRPQKSFDKQYLREYLETLDWDKNPPAPSIPEDVIRKTEAKYIEAYERLTGRKF